MRKAMHYCTWTSGKKRVYQHPCTNKMKLEDLESWGLKPRASLKSFMVSAFYSIRNTALHMAKLYFKIKFMRNTNE